MNVTEYRLAKQFAEIQEVKDLEKPNKNEVRVYCSQYDARDHNNSAYNFQIRTHKGLGWPCGKGKPRDMVATVSLTVKEMEEILAYMHAHS
jgi:poly(3-hydroxybutyrate) depolymerase